MYDVAMPSITQVRYRFQDHWRLRRRLEEGPQIGFIAQEVRRHTAAAHDHDHDESVMQRLRAGSVSSLGLAD